MDLENAAHTNKIIKIGLGGGEGGVIGPCLEKAIFPFLYGKLGCRMGFGHAGVERVTVLVVKNGSDEMRFCGRRSLIGFF